MTRESTTNLSAIKMDLPPSSRRVRLIIPAPLSPFSGRKLKLAPRQNKKRKGNSIYFVRRSTAGVERGWGIVGMRGKGGKDEKRKSRSSKRILELTPQSPAADDLPLCSFPTPPNPLPLPSFPLLSLTLLLTTTPPQAGEETRGGIEFRIDLVQRDAGTEDGREGRKRGAEEMSWGELLRCKRRKVAHSFAEQGSIFFLPTPFHRTTTPPFPTSIHSLLNSTASSASNPTPQSFSTETLRSISTARTISRAAPWRSSGIKTKRRSLMSPSESIEVGTGIGWISTSTRKTSSSSIIAPSTSSEKRTPFPPTSSVENSPSNSIYPSSISPSLSSLPSTPTSSSPHRQSVRDLKPSTAAARKSSATNFRLTRWVIWNSWRISSAAAVVRSRSPEAGTKGSMKRNGKIVPKTLVGGISNGSVQSKVGGNVVGDRRTKVEEEKDRFAQLISQLIRGSSPLSSALQIALHSSANDSRSTLPSPLRPFVSSTSKISFAPLPSSTTITTTETMEKTIMAMAAKSETQMGYRKSPSHPLSICKIGIRHSAISSRFNSVSIAVGGESN